MKVHDSPKRSQVGYPPVSFFTWFWQVPFHQILMVTLLALIIVQSNHRTLVNVSKSQGAHTYSLLA